MACNMPARAPLGRRSWGKGIGAAEGEDWQRQRKAATPAFTPAAVQKQIAQFALAAKPAQHQKLLVTAAANPTASLISRLHAAWGLWMITRREPTALVPLRQLATDPDAVVRANALRVLADVTLLIPVLVFFAAS